MCIRDRLCTAWKRGGYTFEGCMHFVGLMGSSPAHAYYGQWEELGVVPEMSMIHHEIFHIFRDRSGRTLTMYTDIDRLEEELLSLSPRDAQEIKSLCTAVKRYVWLLRTTGKNPVRLVAKGAGILRAISLMKKYADMNIGEYAARFRDPLIRHALTYLFGYPDFACATIFFLLAGNHIRGIGCPQGSSLAFARTMERKFDELGGKIEYRRVVKRIEVQAGRAVGIELEDGTVEAADIIISAADGHATLFEMLGDGYTPADLRERFDTQPLYPPFIQVSLGVNRDMSGAPHVVKIQTADPFEVAGRPRQELWYQHFAFDPTMAPPGKTSLTVLHLSLIHI